MTEVKALLLDIGGVLMTNGWGHQLRMQTAEVFKVDYSEMNSRHHLVFDTYETGKLTFDEYLKRIIFYEERPYSIQDVKQYIFDQVKPFPEMIQMVKDLKEKHHLKVGVVSNEGRELAVDRIKRFELSSFIDFFIVSSFVHFRKPDLDIYRLALDVAQVPPSEIVYIDDRKLLVEVAKTVGIQGIHHRSFESTRDTLETLLSGVGTI
ncbi:MAG: Phosphoglycolate phosphatase [Chlamydiales bacterium]|nr:Phosphoglycolate phosphatase [Chlamydiales bacterium]